MEVKETTTNKTVELQYECKRSDLTEIEIITYNHISALIRILQ